MVLGVAVVAIWVFLLVGRGGFWRMRVEPPPALREPAPRVVAVVPARNEADVVGRAMASLAKQQYGGAFHVVLVDDHSTDDTGAAASKTGVTVITADSLAAGWTGK